LGDVADEEGRHAAPLGQKHEPRGALAHLADASRRRLEPGQEDGLDRVHDERARPELGRVRLDDLEIRLREEVERLRSDAEPIRAQLDLGRRLLARHIAHRSLALGTGRAGARLRRREAAGLTAIDRSDLGHQGFGATTCSLALSPVLIVERMRARRRKLRCAPSRNETMLSYSVGSTTSFPRVPSPALSFSLTARRLARAARTSTPAWPMLSSFPP